MNGLNTKRRLNVKPIYKKNSYKFNFYQPIQLRLYIENKKPDFLMNNLDMPNFDTCRIPDIIQHRYKNIE
jgi:hypothetical protein